MIIACPGCNTRFHLSAAHAQHESLKLRCSRCRKVFTVTGQELRSTAGEAAPARPPAPGVTIAISNQKGGVAKTSTCLNLGMALAARQKRVLLVDFDIQGNLTSALGLRTHASLCDMVEKPSENLWDVITETPYKNVWLLPSNPRLALLSRKNTNGKRPTQILKGFLEGVLTDFDFIIVDTPPSIEFFTLNALIAADFIIIPSQCEAFSIHGVDQIEKAVTFIRQKTYADLDYRILVTMYDSAKTASRVLKENIRKRYGEKVFETLIEMDGKVSESQIVGKPVMYYDPKCRVAAQYAELASEILGSPKGLRAGEARRH